MKCYQLSTGLIFKTDEPVVFSEKGSAFNADYEYSSQKPTPNLSGKIWINGFENVVNDFTFKAQSIVATWAE